MKINFIVVLELIFLVTGWTHAEALDGKITEHKGKISCRYLHSPESGDCFIQDGFYFRKVLEKYELYKKTCVRLKVGGEISCTERSLIKGRGSYVDREILRLTQEDCTRYKYSAGEATSWVEWVFVSQMVFNETVGKFLERVSPFFCDNPVEGRMGLMVLSARYLSAELIERKKSELLIELNRLFVPFFGL